MSDLLPRPQCVGCAKYAEELDEYIAAAREEEISPYAYVVANEGTFNPDNGHFLCTPCYIAAGMPTRPGGWIAP